MSENKLNNPFDPVTGEFAENVRALIGADDTELRQSMEQFGWVKQLPAISDENGVLIVGHRRLRIAQQLKIDPVIETITFGNGDAADAERLKIAITSNVGFKAMTADDRKRIAQYLYGEREWTMQAIGKALNVSQRQISTDLAGLEVTSKPSRPKGGRPKKTTQVRRQKGPHAGGAEAASQNAGSRGDGRRRIDHWSTTSRSSSSTFAASMASTVMPSSSSTSSWEYI